MADGASPLVPRGGGGPPPRRRGPDLAGGILGRGPGAVALVPRRIPGGVAATLDTLPAAALPRLRFEGPVPGLRRALRAALAERLARPRWLANWLLDDVLGHAALVVAMTGAAALRVSLVAGRGEADAGFAVADAPLRLVTAYRGPGLDWLSPRAATGPAWDGEPPAAVLHRLPRGDVAILRGPSPDDPGVAHRAAADPGGVALVLTIDAADRPERAALQ